MSRSHEVSFQYIAPPPEADDEENPDMRLSRSAADRSRDKDGELYDDELVNTKISKM